MKKYLKALVLLLCVCLCWAGVAWGESGNNIVEIGDASGHYTVTLGGYNPAQGKASLSLEKINAWPDKPVTTITAAEGTTVYLYAEPEKHYDNSSPGATASDTGVKISSEGTRYLYSFTLGAQNVTITPNFELKKYAVTFYAGPDGKFDEAQFGGDSEWKLEQENSRAYRFFTYGSKITADFAAPTIEAEPWYVPEWRKQGVSTAFDFENSTVDGVISLNAVWKYTVAFDNNGGTGTMDGVTAYREDTGKYTLPGCTFTAPENKKFSGWSTQATGGTVYKPGDELTLSAEMFTDSTLKLYARWADVHTVTITCQAYRGAEEQTDVEGGSMLIYASEADMNAKENQLPGNSFSGIEGDEFYLVPQADAGYTCGRCERQSSVQGSGEINAIGEMDGEIKYFVFTIGSVDNTLNAKFYLNQYTVTFDLDGGKIESGLPATTPSNPTEKVYHGETVDRLDATPVKEDYTFMDWYQVEAKGAMASKPFDFTTPITSDVTLKAKWGIKITFDPNCPAAEVTGEMDPIITEPSSVWLDSEKCEYKREGYKFIGWCASATPGFDDIIPEGGSLPRTENRTFYAQWEKAKTVSATATLKKGVVGDDVSKMLAFYSDAACTQKIDGDVKGYSGDKVYMKINLDADTKEKVDESGIDVKCDSSPLTATNGVYEITLGKDDVTVNVLLPVKAYTVTVSIVGGKTTHSILVYHGEVLSERSEFTAIETGKQDCAVFAGLYEKDGDGNYTEFDFKNTVITSDVNLYARYKYAIYYDPSSDHPSNVPDTPYTQIIYWDELCDGNTVKLTKNTFTDPQDKQRVKGWQAGNTTFNDEQDVGIDDLRVLAVNDGKINLYAVWANVYTVTVKTEGGYSDVSVKIYTDNQYTGEGMTSYTGFTGDLIYLKADEGEGSEVYKWEGRGKGNLFPGLDMLSAVYGLGEDDEIIVSFKIKKYNVTFYGNGGKVLDQDTAEYVDSYTESVEHGELTSMVVATRDGCGLMDWYEKENNTWKDTPFDAETPITRSIDLYARWSVTVTFDANGGTGSMDSQTFEVNELTALKPNAFTREGYRFDCWTKDRDGNGSFISDEEDASFDKNTTLYAQWEEERTITAQVASEFAGREGFDVLIYTDSGCTEGTGEHFVKAIAGQTLYLKAAVPAHYQVKENGWSLGADDPGKLEANDDYGTVYKFTVGKGNATITVDFELEKIEYGFNAAPGKFAEGQEADGETMSDNYQEITGYVEYGSKITPPASDPTKTGSVFMGWFEKDASGKFADNAFDFDTQIKRAYTLHAKWGYTVTYKPGYEGANQDDVVDTVEGGGTHTTRNANTFTRNGYNLVMWGVNDQSIAPGNQATINEPTVFTAQWEAEKFNLIFDANGGYIADGDGKTTVNIPVPYESLIDEANPGVGAKRDGYRFKGWYEKDENDDLKDEVFDFAENMPDHDVHLYARWDVLYSITLHKGNGSEETKVLESKYIEGEEVILPYPQDWQLPGTAGGSTFAGWNTAADGTGKAYDANDVFTMPGNDVHLYAQWREAEVTPSKVIYHQSGEENAQKFKKTIGGTDTTHTLEEFANTELQKVSGKKFLGWRVGHATTGTLYQPGDKINLLNAETHVYAQWGDYTVTVKCDPEEGGTASIVGGKTEFPGNEQVSVSVNANEGYAFDSWEAKPDTVSINENGTFTMPEADVTVTAHFEKLKKVTFNAGIGHFASEGNPQTITVYVKNGEAVGDQWPADPVFDHYVFRSWEDEDGMTFKSDDPVNSDMTLNASWEQDKHTLTLEYNGGKEEGKEDTSKTISDIMCGNKVKHLGSLPTVSRAGFDFDDWYIVEDNVLTSKKITDETQIDHDITARAMWKYTVTFAPGAETGVTGTQDKVSAFAGEPVTLPACTYAREGYDFKGWMLNEGTTYPAGDSFISETGHVTLTAKWEIKKYTVTFDANGGVFTVEGQTKTQEHATASHGERLASATLTAQENAASKTGHNSAGWYTDAACTTKFDEEKPITSDMTLYMKWEPMRYDITFDAGNGWWGDDTTTHLKTDKADYGTKATAPDDPVYTSGSGDDLKKFRFDGWFTQAEGGTAMEEVTIEQATTFYAHWTPLYWVTVVDLAGNNFPMIHMKADHSDTGVNEVWVPLNTTLYLDPNPSTGYRFDAWPANVVDNVFAVTKAENSRICATYVKQVKVTFDAAQGGTFPAGTGVSDDGRYLEKYVDENSAITPPSPEPQRGFDLLEGWLYDGGPTGGNTSPFDFDTMVISKDSVLHAQWKTGVGVVLDADGGTLAEGTVSPQRVPKGGKAKEPADPTKEECTFLGWYLENAETPFDFGTALDKTITLKARWRAKTYTITIETEGHGTAASNPAGKAAAGTLVQLTATPETGYCLEKWETVSGGVLVEDGQFTMGKQDVTIKAFFGPAGVKVTFDTDGGTPVDPNPASAVYGKPLVQVPSTSKAGFTFQGWYEKDAETPFDFTGPLTGDVTLYARWTAESTPTVTPAPTPDINIIKQPVNTTAPEGGKGTFTVEAQGDGMTYQWFVDRGDGQGFVPCPGATGATYTTNVLKRENNGDRYYCQITTKDGTLRTDTVTLTVEATIPKTGDSANLALWLALTAVSCAGMMAMLQRRRQTK